MLQEREGALELGASKSLDLGEIVKTRADEFVVRNVVPLWAPTDCPSAAKVELQKFFLKIFPNLLTQPRLPSGPFFRAEGRS